MSLGIVRAPVFEKSCKPVYEVTEFGRPKCPQGRVLETDWQFAKRVLFVACSSLNYRCVTGCASRV